MERGAAITYEQDLLETGQSDVLFGGPAHEYSNGSWEVLTIDFGIWTGIWINMLLPPCAKAL